MGFHLSLGECKASLFSAGGSRGPGDSIFGINSVTGDPPVSKILMVI